MSQVLYKTKQPKTKSFLKLLTPQKGKGKELDLYARLVYSCLAYRNRIKDRGYGIKRLSSKLGLHRVTVRTALRKLHELDLINKAGCMYRASPKSSLWSIRSGKSEEKHWSDYYAYCQIRLPRPEARIGKKRFDSIHAVRFWLLHSLWKAHAKEGKLVITNRRLRGLWGITCRRALRQFLQTLKAGGLIAYSSHREGNVQTGYDLACLDVHATNLFPVEQEMEARKPVKQPKPEPKPSIRTGIVGIQYDRVQAMPEIVVSGEPRYVRRDGIMYLAD